MNKFKCPCCENYTFDELPPGTFGICDICGWEDDGYQYKNPDYAGGANNISLNEAKRNYNEYKTIDNDDNEIL